MSPTTNAFILKRSDTKEELGTINFGEVAVVDDPGGWNLLETFCQIYDLKATTYTGPVDITITDTIVSTIKTWNNPIPQKYVEFGALNTYSLVQNNISGIQIDKVNHPFEVNEGGKFAEDLIVRHNLDQLTNSAFNVLVKPLYSPWIRYEETFDWTFTIGAWMIDHGLLYSEAYGYSREWIGTGGHPPGTLTPEPDIIRNGRKYSFDYFYYQYKKESSSVIEKLVYSDIKCDYNRVWSKMWFDDVFMTHRNYINKDEFETVVDNFPPLTNPLFEIKDTGASHNVHFVCSFAIPGKI